MTPPSGVVVKDRFSEKHKGAGPDGYFPYKDSGEVLTSEFIFLDQSGEENRFLRADVNWALCRFTRKIVGSHVKITGELVW